MATRRLGGIATSSSVPDNGGDNSGGGGSAGGYVDDVFSTYVYEGTGAERDIVNGVDLDGEGGLVWTKTRNGSYDHALMDTERGVAGVGGFLKSNATDAAETGFGADYGPKAYNINGYTLGANGSPFNANGVSYCSWTFRKAPSFFDVVTYTGTGVARDIPHNLGVEPGMVIVKSTTSAESWMVYHRSTAATHTMVLNATYAAWAESKIWDNTEPTDAVFTVGTDTSTNLAGEEYVAYVFAHDGSDESMIKCGSYAGNGSIDGPVIDLGFEPQWVLIKNASGNGDWGLVDTMRGQGVDDTSSQRFKINTSGSEVTAQFIKLNSTGFQLTAEVADFNGAGSTFIYIAVRRPNKKAEEFEPEELFAMSPRTASPEKYPYVSNFPVDMGMSRMVTVSTEMRIGSRMTGDKYLQTENNKAEAKDEAWGWWGDMRSAGLGNTLKDDPPYVGWMWRRASGFFDLTCHASNAQPTQQINHNLGVIPEMAWIKSRSLGDADWFVHHKDLTAGTNLRLNTDTPVITDNVASAATFTESYWTPGDSGYTSGGSNTQTYIAYLFASVPGISKVGSYTGTGAGGDGSSMDIDCGFTNGARWLLVKRTDAASDWVMTTGSNVNAPLGMTVSLNTTGQEVWGGYFSPIPSGFNVVESDFNTAGATYIYMAIA